MDTPTTYFHWGFILISVPNLLVIAGMIVLFAIALVVPFPRAEEGELGLGSGRGHVGVRGDVPAKPLGADQAVEGDVHDLGR